MGSKLAKLPEAARQVEPAVVSLGLGWVGALESRERGALLRLENAERGVVEIEIVLTADGPVIRAAAAALEIMAVSDVVARCNRFSVEARESFSVRAPEISHEAVGAMRLEGGDVVVTARAGDVALHANDDVRVRGEQILLNCDRDAPLPAWVPQLPGPTLPPVTEDGDPDVLRDLAKG